MPLDQFKMLIHTIRYILVVPNCMFHVFSPSLELVKGGRILKKILH